MENLPQEILCEIFIFLPPKDLLTITLVCKHFNDVINGSSKVLEKFRLNLNSRQHIDNHSWIGSRRYSRALLKNPGKNSLKILKNVCENLSELRMMLGKVHLTSLRKILVASTKLRDLSLVKVSLIDGEVDGPLPSLKLNSVSTNGNKKLFKILTNCCVRKVSLYSVNLSEDEIVCLKKFLKSQKMLEILEFSSFEEEIKLFDDEILTKVDFRLKEMALHNVKSENLGFFFNFIKLHEMSLESLTIRQDFLSLRINLGLGEILSNFRCLKELSLHKISLPTYFLPTVERLRLQKITNFNFEKICVLFPNLKSLEIMDMTKLKINLSELKNLEEFSLENCVLKSFEIAKVQKLSICESKVDEKVLKVGQFEQLFVDNCEIDFNIWRQFLSDENLNLNVLRVENCFIGEKVRKIMENPKIKNLILIGCDDKVDDEGIKRMKLE